MVVNVFSQFLYRQLLKHLYFSNNKVSSRINMICYAALRKIILKYRDPLVKIKVGNHSLLMNLSHQLPLYIASYPYYDTALPRICAFIKERLGYLTLIDVGANIGDTVSLVSQKVSGKFLCIEADNNFFSLLTKNTANIQIAEKIVCLKLLCSDSKGESHASIISSRGTAHIARGNEPNGKLLQESSIDHLIAENVDFEKCNIIKIDTDGYDYKVLRGSDILLNRAHPVIFFELMPKFLLKIGEDPMSIFDYLARRGYQNVLFYDNTGIPVIKINISEREYISQLINYEKNKNSLFDVLSFHDSMKEDFDLFYEREMAIFK